MIDEVHMLTNTAFNAMLKTLEEPPEYLKFVLATTDPQKVPVTVLSRCLQFNLRPMAPETVLEHLQKVLQAEGIGADTQALRLLARGARGSMRDALSLTDQAIAFSGSGADGRLEEASVRLMLGSVDRSYVFNLIGALAQGDGKTVVETVETLRLNGLSAASTLEEMTTILQRMAVMQAVPNMPVDASDAEAVQTSQLAGDLPKDETQLLYSLCLHGRAELGLAPDEYAALTMVLLRLLAFKPDGSNPPAEKKTFKSVVAAVQPAKFVRPEPAEGSMSNQAQGFVQAQPERETALVEPIVAQKTPKTPVEVVKTPNLEVNMPISGVFTASVAPKFVAIPVREQSAPSARTEQRTERAGLNSAIAPAELVPTPEGDLWHAAVQQLLAAEAIAALVRELALQSQLVARTTPNNDSEPHDWLLRIERESLSQSGSPEKLQSALETLGHSVRISIEIGPASDTPAKRIAAAAAERQRMAQDIITQDAYVQQLMRDFGAKIVPGSIKVTDKQV
jgi:DNA polymerase-3 subunit gamma/tau